jgi:anti-sigma factor RsiW
VNCDAIRSLLDAYLDGETNLPQSLEIEQHLEGCQGCFTTWKNLRATSAWVHDAGLYRSAPAGLEQRIRRSIGLDEPAERRRPMGPRFLAMAAAVLIAAGFWALGQYRATSGHGDLSDELLAAHLRSLQADHLTDVASSDRHTVKPWFQGKLDFAPGVPDLSASGFPLVGGRLEYWDGHPLAALVYKRKQHVINVFASPAESSARPLGQTERHDFQIVHWTWRHIDYWAVSDLTRRDLESFVANWKTATGE